MKGILVLSMEFESPEQVVESVQHLDPTSIPHFAGDLRVALADTASRVESWLDEDIETLEEETA